LKKNRQLSGEALVSPAYHKELVDVLPVNYSLQETVIHLRKHNKWENTCLAKAYSGLFAHLVVSCRQSVMD